jgi:hypothetical protein
MGFSFLAPKLRAERIRFRATAGTPAMVLRRTRNTVV